MEINSWVVGHHVFRHVWTPVIGEVLVCRREAGNPYDPFAVGVYRQGTLVGRVPREHSRHFHELLERRSIVAIIKGPRENRRRRGLEVPCVFQEHWLMYWVPRCDIYLSSDISFILSFTREIFPLHTYCILFLFVKRSSHAWNGY